MDCKHVCVLPEGIPIDSSSSPSRFLRLPHPRTHQPALFMPFEQQIGSEAKRDGLLEVQKVQFEADKGRCWFIEQDIVSDGSISLFSPFDPVFLAISYLSALQPHYRSYADTWDAISSHHFEQPQSTDEKKEGKEEPSFVEDLSRLGQMHCVEQRLLKVCESQEHEGTTLYRLSQPSVLALLKAKVSALAQVSEGVFGPLESTSPGEKKPEEVAPANDENAPPSAKKRRFSTVTRGLGKDAVGNGHGLSEEIQTEARQKYAIGIIANYLPPALAQTLLASYDFPALSAYLSTNTTSAFLDTTYLPGRGSAKFADDGADLGGGAAAAAKKRKAEASKGSRGVEALKKVNTKGMSSLKDMFAKQATAPKKELKEKVPPVIAAKKGKKKA
ncbi:hypothetical protein JCM11251_002431 [Rhodosporidiobolus azoricus]